MTEEARQHVVDADDEQLRHLIHEHMKVFAKFTSENCAACGICIPHRWLEQHFHHQRPLSSGTPAAF